MNLKEPNICRKPLLLQDQRITKCGDRQMIGEFAKFVNLQNLWIAIQWIIFEDIFTFKKNLQKCGLIGVAISGYVSFATSVKPH